MDSLISFTVKLPIAQSLGQLVSSAVEKMKKGEDLTTMEQLCISAAIQGMMKSF